MSESTQHDEWGDNIVRVTVECRVARDHANPTEAAVGMVRDFTGIQSPTNWEGRFAIVTDVRA